MVLCIAGHLRSATLDRLFCSTRVFCLRSTRLSAHVPCLVSTTVSGDRCARRLSGTGALDKDARRRTHSNERLTRRMRHLREDLVLARRRFTEHSDAIRDKILTVPNALCFFRQALAPHLFIPWFRIGLTPVIGALVIGEYYPLAFSLFIIAGATDLLDGWIARRFPLQQSLLGSVLDPVADKLLVSVLFVTLTYSHLLPLPLTVVVLARDACLVVGGFVKRFRTLEPPITFSRFFDPAVSSMQVRPTAISKANTVLQMALVTLSLAAPIFNFSDHLALSALCWITGGTTIASGLLYMRVNAMERIDRSRRK